MSTRCDGKDNQITEALKLSKKKKYLRFQEIKANVLKTNGNVKILNKAAHAVNKESNGSLRTELKKKIPKFEFSPHRLSKEPHTTEE